MNDISKILDNVEQFNSYVYEEKAFVYLIQLLEKSFTCSMSLPISLNNFVIPSPSACTYYEWYK